MASKEHKIVRRAQAMSELARLSQLLSERFSITVASISTSHRDAELAETERIEGVNRLLAQVLEAGSVDEPEVMKKSTKKHGTVK